MIMKHILTRIVLSAALLALPAQALAKNPIEGQWTNPKGNVTVRIDSCGSGYCGTVVNASAKAKEKARKGGTARLIGTLVMRDLRPTGKGTFKGKAFDPKHNVHAPATVRMVGPTTLVVKGCLISGIVCKEQRWNRTG